MGDAGRCLADLELRRLAMAASLDRHVRSLLGLLIGDLPQAAARMLCVTAAPRKPWPPNARACRGRTDGQRGDADFREIVRQTELNWRR